MWVTHDVGTVSFIAPAPGRDGDTNARSSEPFGESVDPPDID
jgi:hypothetical protein